MSYQPPTVGREPIALSVRRQRTAVWENNIKPTIQAWNSDQSLHIDHLGQHIELRYVLGDWAKLMDRPSDQQNRYVKMRKLQCSIQANDVIMGAIEMNEIDLKELEPGTLFGAMDPVGEYAFELGRVIHRGWNFLSAIHAFGTLLNFQLLWMSPAHARSGLWASAAEKIIKAEFPKHAVMVMKAFPLEYKSWSHATNIHVHPDVKQRQRAMVRRFGSLLGMKPFPGLDGRDGWLWRIPPRWDGVVDGPSAYEPGAWLEPPHLTNA